MFCNNCGKEIASDDLFCPFCGVRVNQKKIIIDGNASIESLQKRGMMLLEDGDFFAADEYFNRILSLDPENYYGNLGKQMVKYSLKYEDDFYSFYKNLFSSDEHEDYEVCEEETDHINEMVDKYTVNNYLGAEAIKEKYSFNRIAKTQLSVREKEKQKIKNEFANENSLIRIKKYADKNQKKKINEIFAEYDKRISEAKTSDDKAISCVKNDYIEHIHKTDSEIEKLYESALEKRENDYNKCIDALNTSSDLDILKNSLNLLVAMNGYKDSEKHAEELGAIIGHLEFELQKEKEKRKRIIIAGICVLFVLAFAFYSYYVTVVVPKNKYNEAVSLSEKGQYDDAIALFTELNDYEDSKDQLIETYYKKACYLLSKNKYSESIAIFETLGDYKESVNNTKEAMYKSAIDAYNKESIEEAIKGFNYIQDYKNSKAYLEEINNEYVFLDDFTGRKLSEIKEFLKESNLKYYLKKKNVSGVDNVLSTSPGSGYIKRDSTIVVQVSLGNINLKDYKGDGNGNVIFKIKVEKAGDKVRVRTFPIVLSDLSNKVANLSAGSVQSVYEILEDAGYVWYRIGNRRWIATENGWISIMN